MKLKTFLYLSFLFVTQSNGLELYSSAAMLPKDFDWYASADTVFDKKMNELFPTDQGLQLLQRLTKFTYPYYHYMFFALDDSEYDNYLKQSANQRYRTACWYKYFHGISITQENIIEEIRSLHLLYPSFNPDRELKLHEFCMQSAIEVGNNTIFDIALCNWNKAKEKSVFFAFTSTLLASTFVVAAKYGNVHALNRLLERSKNSLDRKIPLQEAVKNGHDKAAALLQGNTTYSLC